MKGLRWLLLPFSLIYGIIIWFRNRCFDWGWLSSIQHDQFVISVGNIRAGGSGKTPISQYILQLLEQNSIKVAYVSRGYGRKRKGLLGVEKNSSVGDVGDESLMVKSRMPEIPVWVSEKRNNAFGRLEKEKAVILDDAFQHRSVKRNLDLVLTDFQTPFFKDFLLPVGYLRETGKALNRADGVIVTKCPDELSDMDKDRLSKRIRKNNAGLRVFFSGITYNKLHPIWDEKEMASKALLVSGIAKPELFAKQCGKDFEIADHMIFPDHHSFSETEVKRIAEELEKGDRVLITTEKDAMRLRQEKFKTILKGFPCYFLPIQAKFFEKDEFDSWVLESFKSKAL